MLLSIYEASHMRCGSGRGSDDELVESVFEIEEVDSIEDAVERCVRRVADDSNYSVQSQYPDSDFAFVFIRAASPEELALEEPANLTEHYKGESIAGDRCGRLAKFDLNEVVDTQVRAIRAEIERRQRAAAEVVAQRRRELEAEHAKRERFEQFKALKREFEPAGGTGWK